MFRDIEPSPSTAQSLPQLVHIIVGLEAEQAQHRMSEIFGVPSDDYYPYFNRPKRTIKQIDAALALANQSYADALAVPGPSAH